jgi:hypothetical protein
MATTTKQRAGASNPAKRAGSTGQPRSSGSKPLLGKPIRANFYPTYVWGGDHDPVLDRFFTDLEDSGYDLDDVEKVSKIKMNTLNRWKLRKTKKPYHDTIAAAYSSIGFDFIPVKRKK